MIEYRRSARAAALALAAVLASAPLTKAQTPPAQPQDEAYTALIKKHLVDPRFTTELVDHMPASDTVPSPLKFFGRIPGTPGELTYAADIERYYQELARTRAASAPGARARALRSAQMASASRPALSKARPRLLQAWP